VTCQQCGTEAEVFYIEGGTILCKRCQEEKDRKQDAGKTQSPEKGEVMIPCNQKGFGLNEAMSGSRNTQNA
jgi:hypothetical protein